jgi:hypothetical protein
VSALQYSILYNKYNKTFPEIQQIFTTKLDRSHNSLFSVMHQSIVTSAPQPLGNSGDFDIMIFKTLLVKSETKTFVLQVGHFSPAISVPKQNRHIDNTV